MAVRYKISATEKYRKLSGIEKLTAGAKLMGIFGKEAKFGERTNSSEKQDFVVSKPEPLSGDQEKQLRDLGYSLEKV